MFWSDRVSEAIERSFLDGSNRVTLVTNKVRWPSGVTLDTTQRLVYWTDGYNVSSIDYNGNNRRLIFDCYTSLSSTTIYGFDLDISGDYVYFSGWYTNAIHQVKISSSAFVRNIPVPTINSHTGVMGLRVIHRAKQPAG